MVNHFIVVHENGTEAPAVSIHPNRKSAREAFHAIDSGSAALYELHRSQAIKRANLDIVHRESKNTLANKSEKQLRAEARKRNLAIADNQQATSAEIISEIQQDELTRRVDHRRPLTGDKKPSAPVTDVAEHGTQE